MSTAPTGGPRPARRTAAAAAVVAMAAAVPWLAACTGPTRLADVAYDARFGAATTLDVFLPDGGGPAPAVVLLHGGTFTSGDKSEYHLAAERLARSGYVAVTVNHRLAPGAPFPAAVQDTFCALSFLRAGAEDYGIEPDRIAAVGYDSGAHLAAMLGVAAGADDVAPDCEAGPTGPPAAVVGGAGLYDLTKLAGERGVGPYVGAALDEAPELYEAASPALRTGPGAPPFLLVHGDFDFVIPPEQSKILRDALLAHGNDVRLLELFDPGHFLAAGADNGGLYGGGVKDRPESWIALTSFLEDTIGPP
jgi:acetyl esterase/lipase